MAFHKYANAAVMRPEITFSGWDNIRSQEPPFITRSASNVVFKDYNPKDYLITHCTIVASVDTEAGPGPIGKHMVDGFQIDRRHPDYLITSETTPWINNNHDAFERRVLLATYRTFVGSQNYLEHLQIPALSKGKIIDAAARDIGQSVYVDILVATERKHSTLIAAITEGQLQTLSMGCTVAYTQCTKCGNVAEDEAQLCSHIRYFKGSEFYDEFSKRRKIAELCGHYTDLDSVKFIEASWVANPAFRGAVLRNILSEEEASRVAGIVNLGTPSSEPIPGMMQRAAKLGKSGVLHLVSSEWARQGQDFDFTPDSGGEGDAKKEDKKKDPDPIEKIVDDLADNIRERALKKLRDQMGKEEAAKAEQPDDLTAENESIIKSALTHPAWRGIARSVIKVAGSPKAARKILLGLMLHRSGGWKAVRDRGNMTGTEVLAVSRVIDLATKKTAMAGENRLYRVVLAAGGVGSHPSESRYLDVCRKAIARELTEHEKSFLLAKGRLFSIGS